MRQLTHLFSPWTSVDGTSLTSPCSRFFHFSPQWVNFFFLSSHKLLSLNVSTYLLPQLPVNLQNKVQYLPHKKPFIDLNSVIQSRKQLSHFTCAEDFILGHLCGKGCLGLIELSGYLHRSTAVLYIEQGTWSQHLQREMTHLTSQTPIRDRRVWRLWWLALGLLIRALNWGAGGDLPKSHHDALLSLQCPPPPSSSCSS